MNSFKGNPRNKIGHGLIIFMSVFAFMIVNIPRSKTMVSADILGQEVAIDKEKEKIGALKDQPIDKKIIVFEVNGETFTTQELLKRYDLFLIMSEYSEEHRRRIVLESYLDNYILKLLLLQEAGRKGIKVGRDEVEKEKKVYLTRAGLTEYTFSTNLLKAGLTMEDADLYFEDNLVVNRLGSKRFGDIEISDEESREFYSSRNEYFNSPERITASHILICHKESQGRKSALTRQEAKGRAEYIRKAVTPDNFASLAERYSMDPTGAIGGDLGDIYRGTAVPSFEEAAFNLDAGGISNVVETVFGYHIIYVTCKQEARSITFEEAKESIKRDLKEEHISSELFGYSEQLRKDADIKSYAVAGGEVIKEPENKTQATVESVKGVSSSNRFPTFRDTGEGTCTNDEGQPIVILFSTSRCSHCEWIGETFDSAVMEYVEMGLIEAHHYNMDTDTDLLTPNLETGIPKRYLKIMEQGDPEGYVPYFSFGCRYDRTGTGYERQDDLFAEEMEMRKVLNALVRE
jgi:parvulin-like peptidyl-prolyl isomerase/thiol-disulfide isomerase/thioredoxin